jgi:hypothetical protein
VAGAPATNKIKALPNKTGTERNVTRHHAFSEKKTKTQDFIPNYLIHNFATWRDKYGFAICVFFVCFTHATNYRQCTLEPFRIEIKIKLSGMQSKVFQ